MSDINELKAARPSAAPQADGGEKPAAATPVEPQVSSQGPGQRPKPSREPFRMADSIQNMKSIAVNLLMIGATLLALPVSYKIIARNALTINEFTVPSGVEGRGMSGKVLAQRLHDEIFAASRFTSRQIETQGATPVALEQKLPKIDLPVEGLNLALLVPQLRSLFGFRDASISGELIVEQQADNGRPEKYSLRLRAPGEGAIYRSETPSDNVDHLLRDAAIVILQREDPIVAAYYYLFRRDFKAARRMADIASVSANPNTQLLATHVKGLIARGLNEWSEAATHFRAVIKINPDFKAGYSNLASAARRLDINEADAVVSTMIARFPDYWLGHFNLALVRLVQRRIPEGVEAMAKAAALAPRDPEMHFQRQFFLRAMRQNEDAIAALQLAQDLNPTAIHYLEEMVRLQRELGKLTEALNAAVRITFIEPSNPLGFAIVARVLLDSNDFDRAEEAIGKALAIEPEFAPALAERGRLHMMRENWREAESTLILAERSDPRLSETWEYWGDLLTLRKNETEAIAALRKSVEYSVYPSWRGSDPSAKLGKLLEDAGDLNGALEAYERVYRLDRRKYAYIAAEIERLKARVGGKP